MLLALLKDEKGQKQKTIVSFFRLFRSLIPVLNRDEIKGGAFVIRSKVQEQERH